MRSPIFVTDIDFEYFLAIREMCEFACALRIFILNMYGFSFDFGRSRHYAFVECIN